MNKPVCASAMGLAHHIREAITLNKTRRVFYAEKTAKRSIPISNYFIRMQKLALIKAWWIDRQAKPFQREGICIVQDDVISMTKSGDPATMPKRQRVISLAKWDSIRDELVLYCQKTKRMSSVAEFDDIQELTLTYYTYIEKIEAIWDANIAMVKHLLESIGFMARNAQQYSELSDGRTTYLSGALIRAHTSAMKYAAELDIKAQPLHAQCGIVVNDLPAIPFPQTC